MGLFPIPRAPQQSLRGPFSEPLEQLLPIALLDHVVWGLSPPTSPAPSVGQGHSGQSFIDTLGQDQHRFLGNWPVLGLPFLKGRRSPIGAERPSKGQEEAMGSQPPPQHTGRGELAMGSEAGEVAVRSVG